MVSVVVNLEYIDLYDVVWFIVVYDIDDVDVDGWFIVYSVYGFYCVLWELYR